MTVAKRIFEVRIDTDCICFEFFEIIEVPSCFEPTCVFEFIFRCFLIILEFLCVVFNQK